ncbi:MAG TPA: CsgG/HfaB family protein [Vicinamibacterales bacterium]|jgi:curli biogenesis system outer membrane secretion channel CsgG|nr:CsgG/HfaB family protein [Vicinamibacterales bacterium]
MKRGGLSAAVLGITMIVGAGANGFAQEPVRPAIAQDGPARPTLAIADIAVSPGGWTLPPPQMGAAIIDLLLGELVTSQQFHVYDGQWLVPQDEIGGRANIAHLREAAAERHVDYLVLGSVTAFSMVQTGNRGGGILPLHAAGGLGVVSVNRSQLAVAVNFRIVDVRTGEIVTTGSGQGTGTRKSGGLALLGLLRGLPLPLAAAGAHTVANARDAMLAEALKRAVHDAALAISGTAQRLHATERPPDGRNYGTSMESGTTTVPQCRTSSACRPSTTGK